MDVIVGILVIAIGVGTAVLCVALARQALDAARRNAIARLRARPEPLVSGGFHEWTPERPSAPPADGRHAAGGAE